MWEGKRQYHLIGGAPLCKEEQRAGYCWCDTHPGFLTVNLLKNHECLKKHCPFLERFPNHPFWLRRKETKQKRADAKDRRTAERLMLERFRELTSDFEGFAVCAVELKDDVYWVRCVKIQTASLDEVVKTVAREFHARIKIAFVQNSFDVRKELIAVIKEREENKKGG